MRGCQLPVLPMRGAPSHVGVLIEPRARKPGTRINVRGNVSAAASVCCTGFLKCPNGVGPRRSSSSRICRRSRATRSSTLETPHRQRLQHDRVNRRKDPGIRADTNAKRQNRGNGHHPRSTNGAESDSSVTYEGQHVARPSLRWLTGGFRGEIRSAPLGATRRRRRRLRRTAT